MQEDIMNKKLLSLAMSGMVLASSSFSLEAQEINKLSLASTSASNFIKNHKKAVIGTVAGALLTPVMTFFAVKAVKKIVNIKWNKNDKKSNNVTSIKNYTVQSLNRNEVVKIESLPAAEAKKLKSEIELTGVKVVGDIPDVPNNAEGTFVVTSNPKEDGRPKEVNIEFQVSGLVNDKEEAKSEKQQPNENEESKNGEVPSEPVVGDSIEQISKEVENINSKNEEFDDISSYSDSEDVEFVTAEELDKEEDEIEDQEQDAEVKSSEKQGICTIM